MNYELSQQNHTDELKNSETFNKKFRNLETWKL